MKIIQSKGIVKDGEVKARVPFDLSDGEVDLIIVAKNEPDEFEVMIQQAKMNGYDSKEKILDLIHKVKLEMLEEKGRTK